MPPLGYQIPNPSAQPFLILPSTSSLFPSLLDHPYHHYINTLLFSPILIFLLRCNWHTTLCSFQMYNYFSHFKRQLLTPISPPQLCIYFSALHDSKTPRRSYVHCLQIPFLLFSFRITPTGFCFLIFPPKLILLSKSATTSKLLNLMVDV